MSTPSPTENSPPHSVLGDQKIGYQGKVLKIDAALLNSPMGAEEIERRLIEIGFLEGVEVQILHEGAFGRDPIAVRVHHSTIALRRKEARAICVIDA